MKKPKTNNGFTLIELLTVVSIIAMLSSIVLASLSSARDKAKVSAIQQFNSSIYQAKGVDAVGLWDVKSADNQINGQTAVITDSSGQSSGIENVREVKYSSNTPSSEIQGSMYFDGTNTIKIPYNSAMDLTHAGLTYSAWVKVDASAGGSIIVMEIISQQPILYVTIQNKIITAISFGLPVIEGWTHAIAYSKSPRAIFQSNEWNHIAGVLESNGDMKLYLNGNLVKTELGLGRYVTIRYDNPQGKDLYIGSLAGLYQFFKGYIAQPRYYNSGLSATQVQKIYAEGAKKFNLAVK